MRRGGAAAHDVRRTDARCAGSPSAHTAQSLATTTSTSSATTRGSRGSRPGIAAHHAGLVPPMKEAVEEGVRGGPAEGRVRDRDAVARHQHAGAHRRDREAVEVHRRAPRVPDAGGVHPARGPRRPARHRRPSATSSCSGTRSSRSSRSPALASRRTYALTSSFRPTYNMAANLVRRYPPEQARHLLNLSFAQYHADRDVVSLERQLERTREQLARARSAAGPAHGDVAGVPRGCSPTSTRRDRRRRAAQCAAPRRAPARRRRARAAARRQGRSC